MIKAKEFLNDFNITRSANLIPEPAISVIMPTYCRGDNGLLDRAIRSVLNQSFRNFELVIVDDGSIDSTRDVVYKYLNRDHRIVYIRNNKNSGLPAVRVNQAFLHSRGRYIAYQFDDDTWFLDALENLYNKMEEQAQPCLVYGNCNIIFGANDESLIIGGPFNYSKLLDHNCIGNNSVLHSRELYNLYGGYNCHLAMRRLSDWDLWVRWSSEVPFVNMDKLVSVSKSFQENSLGKTCNYDLNLSRTIMGLESNESLQPDRFQEFMVDDLSFLRSASLRKKIFEEYIKEWHQKTFGQIPVFSDYDAKYRKETILLVRHGYDACNVITVQNFMKVLKKKYNLVYVPSDQLNNDVVSYVDIIILQRTVDERTANFLEKVKKRPTVYMTDDNILDLYKLQDPEYKNFGPEGKYYPIIRKQLAKADCVITYNDRVSDSIRPYNKKIMRLKTNILKKYVLANPQKTKENDVFKIAFMGGSARREEFDLLWGDLLQVSQKYGKRVEFYFWGYYPENKPEIMWSKVVKISHRNYYLNLAEMNKHQFDLVLAPLFDNEVKSAKCPIKYLESVVCNGLGLYSNALIYSEIIDGVNGLKADNEKGKWFLKIQQAIEMGEAKRQSMVENARLDILKQYSTESQVFLFQSVMMAAKLHYYLKEKGKVAIFLDGTETDMDRNGLLELALLAEKNSINIIVCVLRWYDKSNFDLGKYFKKTNVKIVYVDKLEGKNKSKALGKFIKEENIKLIHSLTMLPYLDEAVKDSETAYVTGLIDSGFEKAGEDYTLYDRGQMASQYTSWKQFESYARAMKKKKEEVKSKKAGRNEKPNK